MDVRPSRDVLRRGLAVLWLAVREEPKLFGWSVAGSALFGGVTVASAYVVGDITGRVVLPALAARRWSGGPLLAAVLALLAVTLVKVLGILGRRLFAGFMQFRLQATYRRRVTRAYLRLPLSWHHRHPTGELLSNANADVEAVWFPVAPFPFAVGVIVMVGIAGAALVATDPVLAVVALLVFPALFAVNVAYTRHLAPRMTRAQQLRADVSTIAHESFDGAVVVKTLGREAEETRRFAAASDELRDALIAVGRVRGLFDPVMEALPSLGTLAVLGVGSVRLAGGAIGVGQLVSVAFLFTVLAFPVRAIGWVLGELPRAVVGYDRVRRVLTADGAMPYGSALLPAAPRPAALAMREAAYRYPGQVRPAVAGVTFELPAGRTLAVVGPTGSGKSTLAALAVRLIDPDAGCVWLDGVELTGLARGELAAQVAFVGQSVFVFDDTVRGNLTLGRDLGDEALWAALRLAQAEEFVAALPAGLDTPVGERGASLSGGQRQRLALARALAGRPRLLVLDDATSAVDPAVEAAILAGLRTEVAATVLLVAYRPASIGLADQVLYLEHGRVLGHGSPAELFERVPGYRDLVTAFERAERQERAERAERAERDRATGERPTAADLPAAGGRPG